ncbi:Prephenate dehydrogenase [Pseudoxanthomonas sp. GM95]|nr:Prephenate dehydrogenase [Pseudoxanthomonas sp. GM95]
MGSLVTKNREICVGIVGSAGAYGRWLGQFLQRHLGLQVIGHDPADPQSHSPEALIEQAQVLVFSAPIRVTAGLIQDYVSLAAGRERGQLWMDLTSIKSGPVAAMLSSQAEVVGLHPMSAPPKSPTLKGRPMVVCEARLDTWRPWLQTLLDGLEAQCVRTSPEHHDQVMALVQAMVHAGHLAQAGVLRRYADRVGSLAELFPYRSASFEMDGAMIARILSLNPAIYEDIQFGNPHVPEVLDTLVEELSALRDQVGEGGEAARGAFRQHLLADNKAAIGSDALADGNYRFERIGYLLADLAEPCSLSVHLPLDQPGSLRAMLHVFERHGVSIASLHSLRNPAGEVHFRLGFDTGTDLVALAAAADEVDASGIGRVLDRNVFATDLLARPVTGKLGVADLQRRPATEDDIPALLALREATMRAHMENSGADASPASMRTRLLNGYQHADVLLHEGRIAGLLKLDRSGADYVVMQIQVAPALQGFGLGKALLLDYIEEARSAGKDVTLHVLKANPARGLYERLGFVVEGEDPQEFHMRLTLR